MSKIIIKCFDEYTGETTGSSFVFDPETWHEVGSTGSGREGHYSSQGHRVLYASPKKSPKLGRHRFVLYGTGYYPVVPGGGIGNGGLSWGTRATEVDEERAARIIDAEHLAKYFEAPEELV